MHQGVCYHKLEYNSKEELEMLFGPYEKIKNSTNVYSNAKIVTSDLN